MELKLSLNIKNILEYVPDESIWHFIFKDNPEFELGGFFSIRDEDTQPSATVFWGDKVQRYLFKDFGTPGVLTPEKYLANREECTYKEALEIIRQAFSLHHIQEHKVSIDLTEKIKGAKYIPPNLTKREQSQILIRYRARDYGSWSIDKQFWKLLSLDNFKIPKLFNTKPVSHFWIYKNGEWNIWNVSQNNPTYVYVGSNKRMKHKLYTPLSPNKKYKWLSNLGADHIFGLELLPEKGDILVFESSLKDSMVAYMIEIPAIPSLNETTLIPEDTFNFLSKRFTNIISHMNNDEAGVKANQAYEDKYNIKSFINPGSKDDKDNFAFMNNHGLQEFKEMYLTSINNLL